MCIRDRYLDITVHHGQIELKTLGEEIQVPVPILLAVIGIRHQVAVKGIANGPACFGAFYRSIVWSDFFICGTNIIIVFENRNLLDIKRFCITLITTIQTILRMDCNVILYHRLPTSFYCGAC